MNIEEYKKIMGLNSVDIGSRQSLLKACRPLVKKKSGLYKLTKKQLYKIYETHNKI
jgi:hypothetical protein